MAKQITITYTAVTAPVENSTNICAIFVPTNAAADAAAFAGTYYDTNVYGYGEATTLEAFMSQMVAHPGLIAAFRKAINDGTYTFQAEDKEALYLGEVAPAVADQGIKIVIADANAQ